MQNTRTDSAVKILDGTAVAASIREELARGVKELTDSGLRKPGLAVLLIGDDPASQIYVKNKVASCKKVGIESWLYHFPAEVETGAVLSKIAELNAADEVDGILVQLPLPGHLPTEQILMAVSPDKDADGLHPHNLGLLVTGKSGPRPCTPLGIMTLLDRYDIALSGKRAVVIGRSNLVGKPIALMLLEKHATVTICHSRSQDLESIAREADILVAAAGKVHLVRGSWIKAGAVVIDVGIHRQTLASGESKLTGDVDFGEASQVASAITPVPGGIGPMTIAMLLANTFTAYKSKVSVNASGPR